MNESKVALGYKKLIDDNREVLLDGLSAGGEEKEIKQLTSSILTPPELYYFVAVDVEQATMEYDSPKMPANISHSVAKDVSRLPFDTYEVRIYVLDYAVQTEPLESVLQSFEEEHETFRIFTDRIVNLLDHADRVTYELYTMWIPGTRGNEDRRITKSNRPDSWEDENGTYFRLLTEIAFQVRACSTNELPIIG